MTPEERAMERLKAALYVKKEGLVLGDRFWLYGFGEERSFRNEYYTDNPIFPLKNTVAI